MRHGWLSQPHRGRWALGTWMKVFCVSLFLPSFDIPVNFVSDSTLRRKVGGAGVDRVLVVVHRETSVKMRAGIDKKKEVKLESLVNKRAFFLSGFRPSSAKRLESTTKR